MTEKNRIIQTKKMLKILIPICICGIILVFVIVIINLPKKGTHPQIENYSLNQNKPINELLPYDDNEFTVSYPQFDIYTVTLKGTDREKSKEKFQYWLISHQVDISTLQIRYVTQTDLDLIKSILSKLPVESTNFTIQFSPTMTMYVIEIKGKSFDSGKKEVEKWFKEQGLSDMSLIDVYWIDHSNP